MAESGEVGQTVVLAACQQQSWPELLVPCKDKLCPVHPAGCVCVYSSCAQSTRSVQKHTDENLGGAKSPRKRVENDTEETDSALLFNERLEACLERKVY